MYVASINWNSEPGVALIIACVAVVVLVIALWAFFRSGRSSYQSAEDLGRLVNIVADIRRNAAQPAVKAHPEDVAMFNEIGDCIRNQDLSRLRGDYCDSSGNNTASSRRRRSGWFFTLLRFGRYPEREDQ